MRQEILNALKKNQGEYLSGEEISNHLGVSRTAVWKYISALRKEGYDIESSSRKGYRLVSSSGVFSTEEIKTGLSTHFFGSKMIYYPTVTSTNTVAKQLAAGGCEEGTLVIADNQSSGKGRMGRSWSSPPSTGIWMSVILYPKISPMQAPFITILAALAVAVSIEETTQAKPGIKWPNDIVMEKKKVCGILTEMNAEIETINYVVVGIGINVNMQKDDFPSDLHETAASIKMITGQAVNRNMLIRKILENFEHYYMKALIDGNRNEIVSEYKKYSLTLNARVKAQYQSHEIIGVAVDISDEGELLIKTDDGETNKILSGEVSVRG
ncbi:MAG: biotin--[acetyl-CoA-carboxylase] ligase, partial [Clostridia bacterium]